MNNLFLEGPIQTGKSTLIREVLQEAYGPELDGSTTAAGGGAVGGFTVQRMHFPTPGNDKRFGFRLMPSAAPIKAHTCVTTTDENLLASDGVFKIIGCEGGSRTNLEVFETKGVQLLQQAQADAKAGRIGLVLLDEIGGHELACPEFCEILYELLHSEIPCIGVIKQYESALRMKPEIAEANKELHEKITGPNNEHGEILFYERGDETVRAAVTQFIKNSI